ncbi:MAG: choice-of-anchor D domain-containing protein [Calditrichaeota bacterium]|nr:choice-of-anchor D domain-containing protein [Calditrichota bacterium]
MMNKPFAIVPVFLILLFAGYLNAEIIEIGSIDTPGEARGVDVFGELAFVADNQSGLRLIDISNPEEPVETAFIDTPGASFGVTISGNYAYIADGPGGLRIVDISDIENPRAVGAFQGQVNINDVVVAGDYAYLVDDAGILRVVDISSPENPEQIGMLNTVDRAKGVFLSGQNIYIADGRSGLQIVDVANPQQPRIMGSADTPGEANAVFVRDDYAFVADKIRGLRVVNISDPGNPAEIGFFETPGLVFDVTLSTHYAFLADGENGIHILDITDPENPTQVGGRNTVGTAYGVDLSGDYIYVADGERGLRIIYPKPEILLSADELDFGQVDVGEVEGFTLNISNQGHADLIISDVVIEGLYFDCDFEGEAIVEIDEEFELTVIFQPEWPQIREGELTIISNDPEQNEWNVNLSGIGNVMHLVGSWDPPGDSYGICVNGDYAFVADWLSGLYVINISDPENLRHGNLFDTPDRATAVEAQGGFAYVADCNSGLRIIDITDFPRMSEIGDCMTPGSALGIDIIAAEFAYIACSSAGLCIIDISDINNPEEVGVFNTRGMSYDVVVRDDLAYVADNQRGLRVIDVSNPEQPEEVGFCDTPGSAKGVALAEDYAFIADGVSGLRVIDIADPQNPAEIGSYNTIGDSYRVDVREHLVYVADRVGGLRVIEISDPQNPDEVGYYETERAIRDVTIRDNLAYLADWFTGLHIIDISNFYSPEPVIEVDPGNIFFEGVAIDSEEVLILNINNTGESILTIFDIRTEGDHFRIEFDEGLIIEPDSWEAVPVTFSPDSPGEFNGSLTIFSNDPNNEEITVELHGVGNEASRVSFNAGWNLISVNIQPIQEYYQEGEERGPDVILMMEQLQIDEDSHHVILMKNEDGLFYVPSMDFNNIPFWDLSNGYHVNVDAEIQVVWAGDRIPAGTNLLLERGWNLIAYYPTYELDASAPDFDVLSPIIDHVLLAKDNQANFMSPAFNFSNMQPWMESQGYGVKVDADVVLDYPPAP